MTIYNLGSINADYFYHLPHLPKPGETLAATDMSRGLGGKGANMSVAAARAGAHVCHIGSVGQDGGWAVERMMEYGVDTRHIVTADVATGNAVIMVDDAGENAIVLLPGANHAIGKNVIGAALAEASPNDTLLIQNETNNQAYAARLGRDMGMRVAYAAAPFDAAKVQEVLPYLEYLFLNEVEAEQLHQATGQNPASLPVSKVFVTMGAKGCVLFDNDAGQTFEYPALPVKAVDTTGAGDTFTGYVLAALGRGMPMAQAIALATRAGALMVMREGTADAIPDLKDVQDARF